MKMRSWDKLADLNYARNAASACVLNHVIYVIGGEGTSGHLNSIERLDHRNEEAWQLIEVPQDVLSARYYTGFVAINDTEIAILGGCDDRTYYNDVYLFNTKTNIVKLVAPHSGDRGYYVNTNQAALIAHEEVVVLSGQNGNNNPAILTWKKG